MAFASWHRPSLIQVFREGDAFDELHRDVVQTLELAGFIDQDDVRVEQAPRGSGFAAEPAAQTGSALASHRDLQSDRLEGDAASEVGVQRLVHHAHGASSQHTLNVVLPEVERPLRRKHRRNRERRWEAAAILWNRRGALCAVSASVHIRSRAARATHRHDAIPRKVLESLPGARIPLKQ
jgi:hypothetical protein